MQELLLIDKPKGITSYDCIRILKRRYSRGTKMGHAGTLDPMATGLMLIGVGQGTKRLQYFLKLDKTYEAEILLGVQTDTGDSTGNVVKEVNVGTELNSTILQRIVELGAEGIQEVLREIVGKLTLPVPAYSAVKRGGEPLYKKARRGERVEPPLKQMEVTQCELLAICPSRLRGKDNLIIKARFSVSSGTYIRSLAEELGRRLRVPATLAGLRRTQIGDFRVENAQRINP